jgi:hypothetical protein
MTIIELFAILFTLPSSGLRASIGNLEGGLMAQFGNHLSPELSDHLQRIIMATGAINDKVHHLDVIADQLQSTLDGLLDETQIGAQLDLASMPIFAAFWASLLPIRLFLGHLLRSCGVRFVELFHHDRVGDAALDADQR